MKTLGNILESILGHEAIESGKNNPENTWPQIVREAFQTNETAISEEIITKVIEYSKITGMDKNKLTVEVQHSGWIQILSTKQQEILAILQKQNHAITEIIFKLPRRTHCFT